MLKQYSWDYNDFSENALEIRARYLLEKVDNLKGKATSDDISNLPNGRVVVTWGPSSGKTTAIRQYLCKNQMNYIIYATARKSDVDMMYYDLMAMKHAGVIVPECKISKFHTSSDPGEDNLRCSNIILCTHERLMIEPPSILYRLSGDIPNHLGKIIRDEMIIDELPKFYKAFKITDILMTSLGFINSEVDRFNYDKSQRLSYRYSKFVSMINSYIDKDGRLNLGEYGAVKGLLKTYKNNNIMINLSNKGRAIRKFSYFSDLLAEKLHDLTIEDGLLDSGQSEVYYSLLDIEVPNIKIFDGTGDLILKGSRVWNISKDNKFNRFLYLNSKPEVLSDTDLDRNLVEDYSNNEKLNSLINHIKNLIKEGRRVLLYTWKDIRIQYNYYENEESTEEPLKYDLTSIIRSKLSNEENSNLEITYYGSGKERVTSEYSDCDSIVIAGRFLIPNHAIANYNKVNLTNISSIDYTKSLIIQAIYRTKIRHGKSINLYFTSDYSNEIINSTLSEFDKLIIDNKDETGYYKLSNSIKYNSRNYKYYNYISNYFNDIYNNSECIIEVPKSDTTNNSTYTKDYKLSISRLVANTNIIYDNINNSNKFKLIYNK